MNLHSEIVSIRHNPDFQKTYSIDLIPNIVKNCPL